MSDYTKPLPLIDETNSLYWEGLRKRKLILPRCAECCRQHFFTSRYCPNCASERMDWTELSGRGAIWARCAFHQVYFEGFRNEVPYNVVLVELDEGPRVYSNLVGVEGFPDVAIGTRVEAVYEDVTDEVTLLKFRPIS